jgi:hypothetical protein
MCMLHRLRLHVYVHILCQQSAEPWFAGGLIHYCNLKLLLIFKISMVVHVQGHDLYGCSFEWLIRNYFLHD